MLKNKQEPDALTRNGGGKVTKVTNDRLEARVFKQTMM